MLWITTIFRKSEIRRIFILIYVGLGFNLDFGKPTFIICISPPLVKEK